MTRIKTPSDPKTQAGFALVIALSLMAFVLLLILSMTLLVQVETVNSSRALTQLQAKESARLALMIAIGDLQRHAGPDQRVTARADILGDDNYAPEAKHWTGVWRTDNVNNPPKWLVSGVNPNPATAPSPAALLVGAGSLGSGVDTTLFTYAQFEFLENNNGVQTSKYAWWISDEGVKSAVSKVNDIDTLNPAFFSSQPGYTLPVHQQRQILKQVSAQNTGLAVLFGELPNLEPGEIEDLSNPAVLARTQSGLELLQQVPAYGSLSLIENIESTETSSAFYDATLSTFSTLTNTKDGGLKADLSDRNYSNLTSPLKINAATKAFLWDRLPDATSALAIHGLPQTEIDELQTGDPIATTPLVLVEASLSFGVFAERSRSVNARAFLQLKTEVWSPYGFRHALTGSDSVFSPEFTIEFEGLPEITLGFYDIDQDTVTSTTTLNLQDLEPKFEIDLTETTKAGELRTANGHWINNRSSNRDTFNYTDIWEWTVDDPNVNPNHRRYEPPVTVPPTLPGPPPPQDEIRYSAGTSAVNVIIRNMDGDIVSQISNIPFHSINTRANFDIRAPSEMTASDAKIAFNLRLYDDPSSMQGWLKEEDLRSIDFDLSKPETFDLFDLFDIDEIGAGQPDLLNAEIFSNTDLFHGRPNNFFYRLYDTPATLPTSVGIFQHLQLHNMPSYSVGSEYGGAVNSAFDQYFFSGIPGETEVDYWSIQASKGGSPLPNTRIEIYDPQNTLVLTDINTYKSADHLLQKNTFNINSSSPIAWLSLLAGTTIYNWDYIVNQGAKNDDGENSEVTKRAYNLQRPYFSLPFSGHIRSESFTKDLFPFEAYEIETDLEDDYPLLSDLEKADAFKKESVSIGNKVWRPSLNFGHRELTNESLNNLATNIAAKIKLKGEPFASLEDFINSGLLQESIDETDINTIASGLNYTDAAVDKRIPVNYPSFLGQADIISAHANTMTARSDTFKIRATGHSLDPITQRTVSQYTYEATLQRVPTLVDGALESTNTNAEGLGRRFIMIDLICIESTNI
jgi:hypothetical protein